MIICQMGVFLNIEWTGSAGRGDGRSGLGFRQDVRGPQGLDAEERAECRSDAIL
jgi:hypothetical protein